jgi:hypothetical protein
MLQLQMEVLKRMICYLFSFGSVQLHLIFRAVCDVNRNTHFKSNYDLLTTTINTPFLAI